MPKETSERFEVNTDTNTEIAPDKAEENDAVDNLSSEIRYQVSLVISEPEEISYFSLIQNIQDFSQELANKDIIETKDLIEFFNLLQRLTQNLAILLAIDPLIENIETVLNSYKTVLKIGIDISNMQANEKEYINNNSNISIDKLREEIKATANTPSLLQYWKIFKLLNSKTLKIS